MNPFEVYFRKFLNNYKDQFQIEKIDELVTDTDSPKADFLFQNREFIVELKTIEAETILKVQKIVEDDKYVQMPDYPSIYGKTRTDIAFKNFSKKEKLNQEIFEKLTSPIEDSFKDAVKQIKATKKRLNLISSIGILFLLIQYTKAIDLKMAMYRAANLFNKKKSNGDRCYSNLDAALVIFPNTLPLIVTRDRSSQSIKASNLISPLLVCWEMWQTGSL